MKFSIKSLYKLYSSALRHPQYRWLVIFGTLIYFLSPIDLSPDLFPIVGQFDDVVILGLFFTELFKAAIEFFQVKEIPVTPIKNDHDPNLKTIDIDAVSINDQSK